MSELLDKHRLCDTCHHKNDRISYHEVLDYMINSKLTPFNIVVMFPEAIHMHI